MRLHHFLTLLLLLFLLNHSSFAQVSGKATYTVTSELTLSKIMSNSDSLSKEMKDMIAVLDKKSGDGIIIDFHFSPKATLCFYEEDMEKDDERGVDIAKVKAQTMGKIYHDISSETTYTQKELEGSNFIISKNIKDYKWQLLNESKVINDYNCYKAILEIQLNRRGKKSAKVVEAWYTPSIPINSGPAGFAGLPGLIILLKDGKHTTFQMNQINFDSSGKKTKVKKPKKGKKITEAEYQQISSAHFERRLNRRSKRN
ncbi:MAG: GLPGLI family protein [Bacteroidota bacterium]